MVTPAQTPMTLAAGRGAPSTPAEPVPVAFVGRTSTLALQDPRASLNRQLRAARTWLPPGWFIAAVYWDIESGGIDLEHRSQGDGWRAFADADLPRDGGMADLLAEAASPAPKFAAVVCEDIERSGRDMFNALKLEKELSRQGIPLFATDEPADIEGVNATTVLVRRVKQGVAEWYRLQLKEKIWKGLIEHCMDGWNIGTPPYGYAADRIPHPVPFKAAQGRTKSRLILDPDRSTVVEQIFTWRTVGKLGCPAIAAKLNADPASYPPPNPGTGWTAQNVRVMLANPKYTGHMVYGRHRTRNGRRTPAPPDQWLWTPAPVHPAIVDRATWDAAQDVAAGHGTSRDGDEPNSHPATRRFYPYRSRVRCRDCRRRMAGSTYGKPGSLSTYYRCPHDPATPKHAASHPDHPRTVQAPELLLDQIVGQFFATRIFGPGRAELLAAQLPATDADAIADRDAQAARLQARIRRIETAQNSQILELEDLPADPADTAAAAMRARIRARFADLHHEREQIETQLQALAKTTPAAADPALLDELPALGDILPGLPPALKARLFAAFGLEILWNKPAGQATVFVEITENTLQAIPGITDPSQDGYHDTSTETSTDDTAPMWDLGNTPRMGRVPHSCVLRLVDLPGLAALADLAVLVSGQGLDDQVAGVPRAHGVALGVVIADGHRADGVMMAVAGVECQPDRCRAVDTRCGVLDAHRNPDPYPGLGVTTPGADTVDTGNAECVNPTGRRGRRQGAEGKHGGTRGDDGNAAQHGRIPCGELISPKSPAECQQGTIYAICPTFVGRSAVIRSAAFGGAGEDIGRSHA